MVIKNKDGSVYKLKGPNPIAAAQNLWKDFEIHNMDWEDIELPDISEAKKFNSDFDVKDVFSEPVVVEFSEPVVEEVPNAKPDKKRPKIVEKIKTEKKTKSKNITDIWVLPAEIRYDPEKEEGKQYTIKYFNKQLIEAIIISNNGYKLIFWTNVNFCKSGSIIYPYRNSEGNSLHESQWWKVDRVIDEREDDRLKESGGLLHVCVPSEYTPDFSD